jgi:hypothetical protein
LKGQMSSLVNPLLLSSAWAVLPEENSELERETVVDIYPMHFSPYDWRENHHIHGQDESKGGCC